MINIRPLIETNNQEELNKLLDNCFDEFLLKNIYKQIFYYGNEELIKNCSNHKILNNFDEALYVNLINCSIYHSNEDTALLILNIFKIKLTNVLFKFETIEEIIQNKNFKLLKNIIKNKYITAEVFESIINVITSNEKSDLNEEIIKDSNFYFMLKKLITEDINNEKTKKHMLYLASKQTQKKVNLF